MKDGVFSMGTKSVRGKFKRMSVDQHLQHIPKATAHLSHDLVANEARS